MSTRPEIARNFGSLCRGANRSNSCGIRGGCTAARSPVYSVANAHRIGPGSFSTPPNFSISSIRRTVWFLPTCNRENVASIGNTQTETVASGSITERRSATFWASTSWVFDIGMTYAPRGSGNVEPSRMCWSILGLQTLIPSFFPSLKRRSLRSTTPTIRTSRYARVADAVCGPIFPFNHERHDFREP